MRSVLCAALLLVPGVAVAQETPQTGAPAEWAMPMLMSPIVTFVQADRLEGRAADGDGAYLLDLQGWVGTATDKLWVKVEGDGEIGGEAGEAEVQALYSRIVSPFFDVQLGVRQDLGEGPARTHAVVGVQGLAPYWFEVDAAAFISHTGDVTARLEAEYELLFTQRLVLQPRVELNAAFREVEALGLGAGLTSVEGGLRLRYEVRREVAPYVGIDWRQAFGGTAAAARAAGAPTARTAVVAGLRLWY